MPQSRRDHQIRQSRQKKQRRNYRQRRPREYQFLPFLPLHAKKSSRTPLKSRPNAARFCRAECSGAFRVNPSPLQIPPNPFTLNAIFRAVVGDN